MGLAERALAAMNPSRSWPVGQGAISGWQTPYGHDDSLFSSDDAGDSLATSNDVYTVASKRARLMAGLEMRFYNGRRHDKKEIIRHPAIDLFWRVNPFWSAERLARMDELCMSVWGESYWALEPGDRGEPGNIWWCKPSQMHPLVDERKYLTGFAYTPVAGGSPILFTTDEVVWFRYPNPVDEFSALPPLNAAKLAAETAAAMQQSNRKMFSQGMQLAGLIVPADNKVTFSEEQAKDLERQLTRRMTGAEKAHRWAVLRFEAQFRQLGVTQKDAQFVEGLNLSFRQVCRAFGVQSAMLNDLEHATLANASALERIEWSQTLVPDANFRAADVREQYLPKFKSRGAPVWCEYDYGQVPALQESASEAWTREVQALHVGAITINEWRATKGMPSVAWGDRPWVPVNKAQVGEDGMLILPDGAATNPPDDEVNPAHPTPQAAGEAGDGRVVDHMSARRLLAEAFGDPLSTNSRR